MQQPQVLNRALNTHLYKKDVVETGGGRDKNPASILGRAQDSVYSAKNGIRRPFGTVSQHDPDALALDEPETLDLADHSVTTVGPPVPEEPAARGPVGTRVRRSSMTTYTINLGGAAGAQVEREVRRLAGLTPGAFTQSSGSGTEAAAPTHALSFDEVEEMTVDDGGGGGLRAGRRRSVGASGSDAAAVTFLDDDADGSDDDDSRYAFQGGGGGGGSSRAIPSAPRRGFGSSTNVTFDGPAICGGGGGGGMAVGGVMRRRSSACNDAVTALGGSPVGISVGAAFGGSASGSSASGVSGGGANSRASVELLDVKSGSSMASLPDVIRPTTTSTNLRASGAIPAVGFSGGSFSTGQLGLMRDRRAGAGGAGTAAFGAFSVGGRTAPAMSAAGTAAEGGIGSPPLSQGAGGQGATQVVGGGNGGGSGFNSGDNVLRLPSILQPSSRTGSNGSVAQLAFGSVTSPGPAASDSRPSSRPGSRPNSARLLLLRAATTSDVNPHSTNPTSNLGHSSSSFLAASDGAAAGMTKSGSSGFLSGAGGAADGDAGGGDGAYGSAGGATGGGGRWFQQDAEDVEALMLSGDVEMLQRIMEGAESGAGRGESGSGSPGANGVGGDVGVSGDSFTLPRLTEMLPDRAAATLQELRKFQAKFDDAMSAERQAIAQGRVRRSSALEDAVGPHQPRWIPTYNPEAQISHAKLGVVDPNRRSELDSMHLARIAKQGGGGGKAAGGGVAALSPVVARARRLSTVAV